MGGIINKKHQKYYLAIIFAAVLIFLPTHPAKAGWLAEWTFEHTFGYALFLIFSIAGKMIAGLAVLLNWAIHIPVYPDGGIAVINKSWEIMRNFANMFFIVALILMAFATIFDVLPGAAKYNARTLFGRFLFTALLINFSLVLGVMVIDGTQILSNTFLVAIGDMANRLGQDLNPSQLLPDESTITAAVSTDAIVFGTLSTLIFSIVLVFTFLFSILTAFIFTFIRIPILWALLIVSPMAWILNVFPAGEGMFKKWWSTFIGWNMFLPIYLFFLYFGLYFLSNQKDIIQSIASEVSQAKITESLPFSLQLVFFYLMTAIFLIGGTMVAMKASMFSGTGVVNVAKWGRGVAARRLGLTAAGGAAQQKLKQVKEEGLPGRFGKLYGGDYGLAQQTGRFGARFGVRGAELKNQKDFVDRAGKDYADFDRQYQNGQITEAEVVSRAKQFDATDPRGFAYRKLAAKIGQLDPEGEIFTTTLQQLSKNPLAAEDFAKSAKDGKFSRMKGPDLARMAAAEKGVDSKTGIAYDYTSLRGSVAARREMYRYVQTDTKAMSGLNKDQFEAGLGVFGGHTTAEGKAFMKEVAKVAPDLVMSYNLDSTRNPDLRADTEEGFEKAYGAPHTNDFQLKTHVLSGSLKSGDFKETANIQLRVWNADKILSALTTPPTPEQIQQAENAIAFKTALRRYIGQLKTRKARQTYVNNLEKALLNTPGGDKKISELYSDVLDPSYATTSVPVPLVPPTTPAATPLVP